MNYSKLKQDKYGKWTRKTNWTVIGICVAFGITCGLYYYHTHKVGTNGDVTVSLPTLQGNALEGIQTACHKVDQGVWNCSTQEAVEKWNAYLEEKENLRFFATITAYTSRAQETDATPEVGATGENLWILYQQGKNSCASNDYVFGTRLLIPGLGDCTVRDRMNRRYTGTGHIDFYFGYSTSQALKFGSKKLQVIIKQ